MITAIVLIKADVNRIPEVAQAVAEIGSVTQVYSVTGNIDLIAMVRVAKHEDFAEVIAGQINKTVGVASTDTHIAFRAYSSEDLDAAFSIGLD